MNILNRTLETTLRDSARHFPVVTVTGPRQSGKTTLCRKVFPQLAYVSLENTNTRRYAREDPDGFLANLPDGAILDEIQQAPALPSHLQTRVDEDPRKGRFILTGSQQFEVMTTISQSLAGRTALLKLLPFSLEELGAQGKKAKLNQLLLTGFYPRLWQDKLSLAQASGTHVESRPVARSAPGLAPNQVPGAHVESRPAAENTSGPSPTQVLGDYVESYIERDIRQLQTVKDLSLFRRFITLCAGRVGQLLNLNSLANDCGISHQTARNWLTLLEAGFVVFQLPPWFSNVRKRLVKSSKLYFYDVGLACFLLGLEQENHVHRDPLFGNLFENMVVLEALKYRLHRGKRSNLYFYRDSNGNEVDLLLRSGPDVIPVEIKAGMTINQDYFKGINNFAKLTDLPYGAGLVYAGHERQQRGFTKVRPFGDLSDILSSGEADIFGSGESA